MLGGLLSTYDDSDEDDAGGTAAPVAVVTEQPKAPQKKEAVPVYAAAADCQDACVKEGGTIRGAGDADGNANANGLHAAAKKPKAGWEVVLGSLGKKADTTPSSIGAKVQPLLRPQPSPTATMKAPVDDRPIPTTGKHGVRCDCEECEGLLVRFSAKSMQTKGIRFKCKLCDVLMASKQDSQGHFKAEHGVELQKFKHQKSPKLFEVVGKQAAGQATTKISFARADVLGKRPKDDDKSFGGFAKKPKPEPPPCETPEYQEMMNEPVFTLPPWIAKEKPSNADATPEDLQIDEHVTQAQMRRFCTRNILTVDATTVRCKLCYKTLGSNLLAERHVREVHAEDQKKEVVTWERFLHTSCRRQPPFGWVCKICNLFFPTDGAVWRHLGKEVFLRQEERHMGEWHEKEDRWGHEEDEECCGDGINIARGLSYESVQKFNEEQKRMLDQNEADMMDREVLRRRQNGESMAKDPSDAESDAEAQDAPGQGEIRLIQEF